MPRNEFKQADPLEGKTDLEIQDMLKEGKCTVNDVRRHRGLPPAGKPVSEEKSLESESVETTPESGKSLADLRKEPGFTTTEAHRRTAT